MATAGRTWQLGFQPVPKMRTIHASSGFIRGIPAYPDGGCVVRLALPKFSQLVCVAWVLLATAASGMLIAWPQATLAADNETFEVGIAGLRFDPKQVDRAIPERLRMSDQELIKHRGQPSYYLV